MNILPTVVFHQTNEYFTKYFFRRSRFHDAFDLFYIVSYKCDAWADEIALVEN